ncbi:MAG: GFA family protein [Alphaproteobacteria bacterium]
MHYESNEPPGTDGTICHCRTCQKAYGHGFAVAADFSSKAFCFTQGKPRMYESSKFGERGFCADCGSPVIMVYTSLPEKLWIHVGTLDNPDVAKD